MCGSGVFTCHVYDDALIIFQRAWMWTRQPERLEDLCAALFYSGVDDKRERAGLSSQSSGWLGARGNGPIVIRMTIYHVMFVPRQSLLLPDPLELCRN